MTGIVPHHKAGLPADIEEERRLFYVALTRAKDRLHVAAVRERYHRKTDVSRFIRGSRFVEDSERSQSHCGLGRRKGTIAENSSFLL